MAALNMVAHNVGGEPTFVRGESRSYIDVTCSTTGIARRIENWEIITEENLTEHCSIFFKI